jgi:hypothetical protein
MADSENTLKAGWSWSAFILGPVWYFSKGMAKKGLWLSVFCIITFLCAVPFVWLYCGARGKGDYSEHILQQKSRFNLNKI